MSKNDSNIRMFAQSPEKKSKNLEKLEKKL